MSVRPCLCPSVRPCTYVCHYKMCSRFRTHLIKAMKTELICCYLSTCVQCSVDLVGKLYQSFDF